MRFAQSSSVKGRGAILSCLWPRANRSTSPFIPLLLSAQEFELELLRQRARSDRTGSHFLLLSFSLGDRLKNHKAPDQVIQLLAQIIAERSRISDIAGWHGRRHTHIGLILPGTPSDAASCVVHAIEAIFVRTTLATSFDLRMSEISCDVFRYPSDRQEQERPPILMGGGRGDSG